MALSEQYQALVVRHYADQLTNPSFHRAVEESLILHEKQPEPFFLGEFRFLDMTIARANKFLAQKTVPHDSDLINIYNNVWSPDYLPPLFSWKNKQEKDLWTGTLEKTMDDLNQESSSQLASENDNPQELFRSLIFNGYARWFAKTYPATSLTEQDQIKYVLNMLYEATVVAGEQDDYTIAEVVCWMRQRDWFNEKQFSEGLIRRVDTTISFYKIDTLRADEYMNEIRSQEKDMPIAVPADIAGYYERRAAMQYKIAEQMDAEGFEEDAKTNRREGNYSYMMAESAIGNGQYALEQIKAIRDGIVMRVQYLEKDYANGTAKRKRQMLRDPNGYRVIEGWRKSIERYNVFIEILEKKRE